MNFAEVGKKPKYDLPPCGITWGEPIKIFYSGINKSGHNLTGDDQLGQCMRMCAQQPWCTSINFTPDNTVEDGTQCFLQAAGEGCAKPSATYEWYELQNRWTYFPKSAISGVNTEHIDEFHTPEEC